MKSLFFTCLITLAASPSLACSPTAEVLQMNVYDHMQQADIAFIGRYEKHVTISGSLKQKPDAEALSVEPDIIEHDIKFNVVKSLKGDVPESITLLTARTSACGASLDTFLKNPYSLVFANKYRYFHTTNAFSGNKGFASKKAALKYVNSKASSGISKKIK